MVVVSRPPLRPHRPRPFPAGGGVAPRYTHTMIRVTWLDEVQYEGDDLSDIVRQLCAEPANPDNPQEMLDALIDRTSVLYRIEGGYSTDPADVFARLAEAGVILLEREDADGNTAAFDARPPKPAKGMLTP